MSRVHLSGVILWMTAALAEPRDYCQSQYFNATCPPRNFVIMTSASYGRIKTGSCLSGNYGQMGCFEDVLDYMDRKCSGRRHCSVYIAETALHNKNPCPRDLAVYLEAEFKCVKGLTSSLAQCSQQRQLTLTSPSGYLTSVEATENGYGTSQCPWVIKVDPGQQIAFDFYNFEGSDTGGLSGCYDLGTIMSNGKEKSITTCGSSFGRIGNIFTSDGNEAKVKFLRREILSSKTPFVLYYEVRGCPRNITAPPGGWVKYENKMATIKCNRTEELWYLTCSGSRWVGERGNCSKKLDSSWSHKQTRTEGSDGFPFGILIVVAIGVALGVFIGGLVLSLVYFYMKRKRNPYQEPPQAADQQQQQECYHGSSTLKKQPPRSPGGVLVPRDTYPPIQFDDREHVCSNISHAHEGYYSTKAKNFGVQRVYDACASSAQRSGHVYESTQLS